MRGTRFELDEQKASKLSGISVDGMWNFINEKAKEANLIVVKNGEYHARGTEHDLGDIGVFVVTEMLKIEWFTKSVKSWVQFRDDIDENVIEISMKAKVGVWE